uniref:G-protein coupled receptors family 1 profile domain-containing protein n=1 Tax=Plectus sambesii TaxID=2011161 RepID=A0A914WSF9_9BILA
MANRWVPVDFYGAPAYWFEIVTSIFGLDIFLSNMLLLWIAASSREIRTLPSNYFTINLAFGNTLVGSFYAFLQPFVLNYGDTSPVLCHICGFGNITFAMSFLFSPTLMAASRYYNVTRLPSSSGSNWFSSRAFFTKIGALSLLVAFWSYAILLPLFLLAIDQLGEDPSGFCGAKAFTSPLLYIIYIISLIIFALFNAVLTYIYFHRLSKFMAQYQRRPSDVSSTDTRSVMRLVAITAILPLICNSPTLLLSGGQWFIPDVMPMWLKRILVLPVFIPPMVGPWLTLLLLRPFKKRFNEKVMAKMWRRPTMTAGLIEPTPQPNDAVNVVQRPPVHRTTSVIVYDAAGRQRPPPHPLKATLSVP